MPDKATTLLLIKQHCVEKLSTSLLLSQELRGQQLGGANQTHSIHRSSAGVTASIKAGVFSSFLFRSIQMGANRKKKSVDKQL